MRLSPLKATVEEIKKGDGDTAVTPGMLRTLVKSKKITHLYRGNKLVLDADKLPEELNGLLGLNKNKTMPRIRSIHKAYLELRKESPELAISEELIRILVAMGELPCVRVGNRAYIALESFDPQYNVVSLSVNYREREDEMLKRRAREQFNNNISRKNNSKGGK